MTAGTLRIRHDIVIDESEIEERFIRASGPGGQNVNKVSSAVQLRFDIANSPALSDAMRARLKVLAGRRVTRDGVLVITAQRYRTQDGNRQDARARLADLIARAAEAPRPRRATAPPRAAKEQRIARKTRRGAVKSLRARPRPHDEE